MLHRAENKSRNILLWIMPGMFLALACAFGQPLLVQQTSPGSVSIRTFAGRAECAANPVMPAPGLTAAIFPGSIDAHDIDRVVTELTGLYKSLHTDHPITLAVYSEHEWKTAGPFRSLPQWRASLNNLLKPADAASESYAATQLYELLAVSAPQFGSDWASVIFIGKLPPVEADLRDYAVAYLGSKFRAQRLVLWAGEPRIPMNGGSGYSTMLHGVQVHSSFSYAMYQLLAASVPQFSDMAGFAHAQVTVFGGGERQSNASQFPYKY